MPEWDVFHSERLEAERALTTEAVLDALARGDLIEDDLVRPSGDTRWTRIGDAPEFAAAAPPAEESPPPGPSWIEEERAEAEGPFDDFEIDPEAFAAIDRETLRLAET